MSSRPQQVNPNTAQHTVNHRFNLPIRHRPQEHPMNTSHMSIFPKYDFRNVFSSKGMFKRDTKHIEFDFNRFMKFISNEIVPELDKSQCVPLTNIDEFHYSIDLIDFEITRLFTLPETKSNFSDLSDFVNRMQTCYTLHYTNDNFFDNLIIFLNPRNTFNIYSIYNMVNSDIVLKHITFMMDLLEYNLNILMSNPRLDQLAIKRNSRSYYDFNVFYVKTLGEFYGNTQLINEKLFEYFVVMSSLCKSSLQTQINSLIAIDKLIALIFNSIIHSRIESGNHSLYSKQFQKLLQYTQYDNISPFRRILLDDHNRRQIFYYYRIDVHSYQYLPYFYTLNMFEMSDLLLRDIHQQQLYQASNQSLNGRIVQSFIDYNQLMVHIVHTIHQVGIHFYTPPTEEKLKYVIEVLYNIIKDLNILSENESNYYRQEKQYHQLLTVKYMFRFIDMNNIIKNFHKWCNMNLLELIQVQPTQSTPETETVSVEELTEQIEQLQTETQNEIIEILVLPTNTDVEQFHNSTFHENYTVLDLLESEQFLFTEILNEISHPLHHILNSY